MEAAGRHPFWPAPGRKKPYGDIQLPAALPAGPQGLGGRRATGSQGRRRPPARPGGPPLFDAKDRRRQVDHSAEEITRPDLHPPRPPTASWGTNFNGTNYFLNLESQDPDPRCPATGACEVRRTWSGGTPAPFLRPQRSMGRSPISNQYAGYFISRACPTLGPASGQQRHPGARYRALPTFTGHPDGRPPAGLPWLTVTPHAPPPDSGAHWINPKTGQAGRPPAGTSTPSDGTPPRPKFFDGGRPAPSVKEGSHERPVIDRRKAIAGGDPKTRWKGGRGRFHSGLRAVVPGALVVVPQRGNDSGQPRFFTSKNKVQKPARNWGMNSHLANHLPVGDEPQEKQADGFWCRKAPCGTRPCMASWSSCRSNKQPARRACAAGH